MSTEEYIVFGATLLLFLSVFFILFWFISYIIDGQIIRNKLNEYYKKTQENTITRKEQQEKELLEHGYQEKTPLLQKLDNLIEGSGITSKIKFLNADIFVASMIFLSALVFVITVYATGETFYGLLSLSIVIILLITILLYLNNLNKTRVEEELMNFINLIENYSKTSDDIIHIIGRIFPYINEPIKSAAEECYLEGQRTGNVSKSLDNLAKKVNHKKFKEIIRSLSICSRYEANYSDVAEDSRKMLIEYLAGKRERAAIVRNARIELSVILGMAILMIYMLGSFVGANIIDLLLSNILGKILLLYSFIAVLICIVSLILMGE